MVQIGFIMMAVGLVFVGVQGLRQIPDSKGKTTSKPVAIACLVIAALLLVGALAFPFVIEFFLPPLRIR